MTGTTGGRGTRALWPIILMAVVLSACRTKAPEAPALGASAPSHTQVDFLPAIDGDYFAHASDAVGRTFHIHVRLPEDYGEKADARYPVVYVLDGDSLFPILGASHLFLVHDDGIPEAIVVGIAYGGFDPVVNKRSYDYSAPAPDAGEGRGGAPAFHAFLKSELIPEVERRYRADPARRVLFGQSRGGHFVLYSAFTDPDLFWGRIASNPAFDPGREAFFATPSPAMRRDLGLVLTSGERDRPALRAAAMDWSAHWDRHRRDAPWTIEVATIPGGTHAADSGNSYRLGVNWLFDRLAPSEGDGQ